MGVLIKHNVNKGGMIIVLKVGNRVLIREDLEVGKISDVGYFVDNSIFNAKGKVFSVKEIFDDGSFTLDGLNDSSYKCYLVEEWVLPVDGDVKFKCSICGNEHLVQDLKYKNGIGYVCNTCLENTVLCSRCGKVLLQTQKTIDGEVYCDDCINQFSYINSWHSYGSNWKNRVVDQSDKSLLIGTELEIDRGSNNRETAKLIAKIMGNSFIYANDGSLDCGFELISHPFSFNFWQDKVNYIKDMMDICVSKGYKSHDVNTCGLHFHVNREQLKTSSRTHDEVVDNILLIMETFKDELCTFGRRHSTQYAQFLQDSTGRRTISLKYIKNSKITDSRYMALNLQNRKTIEFRFFKGTLKHETFMASVELVNNLCNIAMYEDIDGLTWQDIIDYNADKNKYIVDYNRSRGIVTDKKVQVLSYFELHRDEFTIEKFKSGDFTIRLDGDCTRDQRHFLLGMFYALGLKDGDGNQLKDNDIYNSRLKVRSNGTVTTMGRTNVVDGRDLIQFWMGV
jgi:hypothetical protein